MSKRNTYLLSGAAILIGIALVVIALTALSGDDNGGSGTTAAQTTPPRAGRSAAPGEQSDQGQRSGDRSQGSAQSRPPGSSVSKQLDQRRTVPAPGIVLGVVDGGSPPAQGLGPLREAVSGDALALTKLRGTPVVLYLWSSKCGPCRSDARLIETTWQRWGRRGVAFLGVSVDEPVKDAERFAREYRLTYPILSDSGGRAARAYGVTSLPETFFISRTGEVVGHVAGSPSVRQMELGAAAARTGRRFGNEQGGSREPLG